MDSREVHRLGLPGGVCTKPITRPRCMHSVESGSRRPCPVDHLHHCHLRPGSDTKDRDFRVAPAPSRPLGRDRLEPRSGAVSLPGLLPDGRGRLLHIRWAHDRRDVLRRRFRLQVCGSIRYGSRLRPRFRAGASCGGRHRDARPVFRAPDPDPPHRRARGPEDLTSEETRAR